MTPRSPRSVPAILTLILSTLLPVPLLARPTLAILEYHLRHSGAEATARTADQIRDRLSHRWRGTVLSKRQTEDLFFYHQKALLDGASGTGERLFQEAKRDYYEFRLEAAEKKFRRVVASAEERTLVEARLMLGLTLVGLGDEAKARPHFREAWRLDPTRELDPRLFSPKARRLFRSVRKESLPESALEIDSRPQGLDVFVNGIYRGITPLRISPFPAGEHTVRVQSAQYEPRVRKVDLPRGEPVRLLISTVWNYRPGGERLGFSEADFPETGPLLDAVARAGDLLGVEKVLLVSAVTRGEEGVETWLVDTDLRGGRPAQKYLGPPEEESLQIAEKVAADVRSEMRDELVGPGPLENRYGGDIVLLARRGRPFYKKPIFWVAMGAVAGTGGGLAAALAGGSGAIGAIGVIFQ